MLGHDDLHIRNYEDISKNYRDIVRNYKHIDRNYKDITKNYKDTVMLSAHLINRQDVVFDE